MRTSEDPEGAIPLKTLDDWDDFISERVYPIDGARARSNYRDFESPTRDSVRALYRLNHRFQTLDFVLVKETEYGSLDRRRMSTLEALEFLDTLIDDSDLELSQLQHLLQTSEAIRRDGHPDWFVLTGLLHDDLYSKSPQPPDWQALRPYYEQLIANYLPTVLHF